MFYQNDTCEHAVHEQMYIAATHSTSQAHIHTHLHFFLFLFFYFYYHPSHQLCLCVPWSLLLCFLTNTIILLSFTALPNPKGFTVTLTETHIPTVPLPNNIYQKSLFHECRINQGQAGARSQAQTRRLSIGDSLCLQDTLMCTLTSLCDMQAHTHTCQ